MPLTIKPSHKLITEYYQAMQQARDTQQLHEGAVAPHFAQVLRHCVSQFPHLALVEQYSIKRDGRKALRADGALVDKQTNVLVYGIWEAKDSKDRLEKEVQSKFKDGYPDDNILFQSPDQVILYQNGIQAFAAIIADDPQQLITALQMFFSYKPPAYGQWEEAIGAFKDQVGDLGRALVQIILGELKRNKLFKAAFDNFSELCKASLNPNLAQEAVIEMLVQHLLTERLFRTIFNNNDFVSNNVIAREIELVIKTLTSRSFSRHEFLKSLDRFYLAIEETASTISAYSQKQDFLNAVYENFFQGFAVKVADTHGIVYTPQPIVDFMVNSVQEILKREFNEDLANPNVQVLDPFTGTGNFILRIMQEIATDPTPQPPLPNRRGEDKELSEGRRRTTFERMDKLRHKYAEELHCNEIMLLPYYIASMNIEHSYFEYLREYAPFPGICLVDTFELAEPQQGEFIFEVENTKRVDKQKDTPIFVIIGNPPYNVGQQNENDNNKNRKYKHIDSIVADTYAKQSKATNKNSLSDAYVKAFAWATERLQTQDKGIIAFVSNSGFIDGIATDGMRKTLGETFNNIYIFDLGGNSRKSDDDPGNVFGIRVGVAITLLVKNGSNSSNIYYACIGKNLKQAAKLEFLEDAKHIFNLQLRSIVPDPKYNWLTDGLEADFATFMLMGSKGGKASKSQVQDVIFKLYSNGVKTNRDTWVYNFNAEELANNVQSCIRVYNEHVFAFSRLSSKPNIDNFVTYDDKKLSWSLGLKISLQRGNFAEFKPEKIRISLYRPFSKKNLFFDRIMNEAVYRFPGIFPTLETEQENLVICVAGIGDRKGFSCLVTKLIPSLDLAFEKSQCFPFYT